MACETPLGLEKGYERWGAPVLNDAIRMVEALDYLIVARMADRVSGLEARGAREGCAV